MSKSVSSSNGGGSIPANDDRFSRFSLIGWWDQEKLRSARVLVIGAGALGSSAAVLVPDSDHTDLPCGRSS